jgi:hypothetical protein
MKTKAIVFGIILGIVLAFPMIGHSQYSMEEMGIEGGGGWAIFPNSAKSLAGPAFNANYFFSHYACGKAYGLHFTGGFAGFLPSAADATNILDDATAGKASLRFAGFELGAMGKIRIHEYHRPKEWAVFLGPKLQIPLMAAYSSENGNGGLRDKVSSVGAFWPGVHLSVQFRQPASKKKSWFIRTGAEYYLTPAFQSVGAGSVQPLYLFLNFGYAFWDKRG